MKANDWNWKMTWFCHPSRKEPPSSRILLHPTESLLKSEHWESVAGTFWRHWSLTPEFWEAWSHISWEVASFNYHGLTDPLVWSVYWWGRLRLRVGLSWANWLYLPKFSFHLNLRWLKNPHWLPKVPRLYKTLSGYTSHSEQNSKWVVDLHVKCKTVKHWHKNIGENPQDLVLEEFVSRKPKDDP